MSKLCLQTYCVQIRRQNKERPCGPEKGLQARLLLRIAVSTDRTFTNTCLQHTGTLDHTKKYQTSIRHLSLPTKLQVSINRTISQACILINLIMIKYVTPKINEIYIYIAYIALS